MRQLTEVHELEQEIALLRDALILSKAELHRIRGEYLQGAQSLSPKAIDEMDEELETVTRTIENALF